VREGGLEQGPQSSGKTGIDGEGAAESGAVGAAEAHSGQATGTLEAVGIDPALRLLIEVWNALPDAVKNRVLRIVDEAVSAAR